MENYKNQILAHLLTLFRATPEQQKMIDRIYEGVSYAWNFWNCEIIADYIDLSEKTKVPNEKFITLWLDNTDLEADGYNVEYLREIFV